MIIKKIKFYYINNKFKSNEIKSYYQKRKYIYFIYSLVIFFLISFIFFNSQTKIKQTKVCLCVIGKKENLYANEFVNHYKKIGYDKIFIYDNNNIGDEKFEDVLNKQISSNFVEIINFRGYRGKRQKPQNDAYFHCYEKKKKFIIGSLFLILMNFLF
jgi:hypothetical protein